MALDFLILYEHTVREYESDLLLKLELERRGYSAEIRQLLDPKHLRLFRRDKPEVLVASCMYDNEAINSHVYNNIGRCDKIVNLHWEQMLSDTQEEGDWFNMNGQRQALHPEPAGASAPPGGCRPTAWTATEHPGHRRGDDGLPAAGVQGLFSRQAGPVRKNSAWTRPSTCTCISPASATPA